MILMINKQNFKILFLFVIGFFTNSSVGAIPFQMTEKQKIEYLIQSVEKLDGAKFYRNGEWHTPKEAADHLRLKLKNAGGKIKTARQFIDKIASESSFSGQAYKIKFKNGQIVESKIFFNQQLAKLK
jgi:hypothetical protein